MEWEYKTQAIRVLTKTEVENDQMFLDPNLTEDSKAKFKELGEQGWELVSVMSMERGTTLGSAATRNGMAFFKRQKNNT